MRKPVIARFLNPLVLAPVVLVLGATGAGAQDASVDDRLRETLRRMTVDLRTAQDNQATLQAQLDQSQKQRDLLQQQVAALNAKLGQQPAAQAAQPAQTAASAVEIQQLRDVVAAMKQQDASLQEGLSHWQSAYQQAAGIAREKDAESRQLSVTARSATGTLDVCEAKNTKLIAVANDILHLYRAQSFRSLLLKSYEPLLGYKQVELENIVQDNEDRIRAQQYYPGEQPPHPTVVQAAGQPAGTEAAASKPLPQTGQSK
jgi:predicted  nucleic acid-binding Zn-ribbon protein